MKPFRQALKYGSKIAAGAAVALSPAVVMAAAIDVDDLVTDIGLQAAPLAAVASAVLMILFGVVAFKWVRRAF